MAWSGLRSLVGRGGVTLAAVGPFAVGCGDGTGPAPVEPLIGALQVSAASPSGWAFLVEGAGGEGGYVAGPAGQPLGFGSARLYVPGATGGIILGTQAYGGTRLDQITALQYSSYVTLGSGNAVAAALQFNIDYDLTDANTSWQGRLVYEPYFTQTVTQGTWQTLSPLTGKWWATGGPGIGICPMATPCTWTQVLTTFPNAGIQTGALSGLLFKAGSGWAASTVHVDAFVITAAGVTETYDFEPSLEPCSFTSEDAARRVRLTADCITDHTLYIPNGWTVDGAGHTITAVDPGAGGFLGAVVRNAGGRAHARNLHIIGTVSGGCHGGDQRLRGIMFEGASGTILFSTVENIHRVGSYGCQEGNGIEVRNAPFDGTHPNTQEVLIQQNTVLRYQKTGILANGDVRVVISGNVVSSAATANGDNLDDHIAANSIQVGFGAAHATIQGNRIQGNDWDGASNFSGTAILLYEAQDVEVTSNQIGTEAPEPLDQQTDVGVFAFSSGIVNVMNNYIGRHGEAEGGKPCEGRDDSNWLPDPLPPDKCDPDGVGVYFFENDGISKAVSNRFSNNWRVLQVGADRAHANRVVSPAP